MTVAPVMAQLGVVNCALSASFYRDALGFSTEELYHDDGHLRVAELRLGQARLQVAEHDGVRDTPEQRSARHSIILFFECDDVKALHEAVTARGANASALSIEELWIRMQMFEIEDPDGHTLWFGQRLQQEHQGARDRPRPPF
jgi:uncharacterized glyoxalase superfamily protein PhnB